MAGGEALSAFVASGPGAGAVAGVCAGAFATGFGGSVALSGLLPHAASIAAAINSVAQRCMVISPSKEWMPGCSAVQRKVQANRSEDALGNYR